MLPIILLVIFGVCFFTGTPTLGFDYCEFYPFHTMCLYGRRQIVDCLGNEFGDGKDHYVPEGRLTLQEKHIIRDAHNKLRANVANGYLYSAKNPFLYLPKATAMYQLDWDYELERIAQAYADQCQNVKFDVNRDVTRFPVGQNIYYSCYTNASNSFQVAELIDVWAETRYHITKERFYGYSPRLEYQNNMRLFTFAQMVWGTSTYIGCARAVFKGMKKVPDETNVEVEVWISQYVCNYGHAGIELRQPMYRIGEPKSTCCKYTSAAWPGLCVPCPKDHPKRGLPDG